MVVGDAFSLWISREVKFMLREILRTRNIFALKNRELNLEEEQRLCHWIAKRKEGYPLQYIFGHWDFYGLNFLVDERALIPRPETEELVDRLIGRIHDGQEVLEIGVGSGVILLSLSVNQPKCHYVGTDISKEALALTDENAIHLKTNVELIQSDVYDNLKNRKFHWIISNPPYIDDEGMNELRKELSFEPANALYGGPDGLLVYKKIIEEAYEHLYNQGNIAMEIGYNQKEAIFSLLETNGFENLECFQDYAGFDRMIFAKLREKRD